jgi:plastocyanin
MHLMLLVPLLGFALLGTTTHAAMAADTPVFTLTIKDHKFDPAEVQVPANQKIELRVVNKDSTAEEFESVDLHREKVVAGNREITVSVGPLKPGTYEFFGEFNPKTARGRLVAR